MEEVAVVVNGQGIIRKTTTDTHIAMIGGQLEACVALELVLVNTVHDFTLSAKT